MSMRGHKNAEQEQQQQDQDQAEVEDTYEYCACKRKTAECGESAECGVEGRECLQLIAFGCFTIR